MVLNEQNGGVVERFTPPEIIEQARDGARLRFLLCRSGLLAADRARIERDDQGVKWLGRSAKTRGAA